MKSRLFAFAFAFSCLWGSTASASTITVTSLGGPNFLTFSGELLPLNSLIRVGYINNFEANESAIRNGSVIDALSIIEADFREIGSAVAAAGSGTGTIQINDPFGQRGKVSGQVTQVNDGATYVPGGEKLTLVVYNSDAANTATEWGVFISSGTGWDMPNDSLSDQTLNTNESADALRGSIDGGLRLEAIPEPSVSLLILGALAGMLGFQRRR